MRVSKARKRPKPRRAFRNLGPAKPRPRPRAAALKVSPGVWTAVGVGLGSAAGAMAARLSMSPALVTGGTGLVGAAMALAGEGPMRGLGAGAAAAAAGQFVMLKLDGRPDGGAKPAPQGQPKRNADLLPPGALETALERARTRLALVSSELPDD